MIRSHGQGELTLTGLPYSQEQDFGLRLFLVRGTRRAAKGILGIPWLAAAMGGKKEKKQKKDQNVQQQPFGLTRWAFSTYCEKVIIVGNANP